MYEQQHIALKSEVLKYLHNNARNMDKAIFVVPRILVSILGDHTSALMLSQMMYWSENTRDEAGWFYKSHQQWMEELCLSRHEVLKALAQLTGMGFIQRTHRRISNGHRVNHYRVLKEPLMEAINLELVFN